MFKLCSSQLFESREEVFADLQRIAEIFIQYNYLMRQSEQE